MQETNLMFLIIFGYFTQKLEISVLDILQVSK